MDFVILDARRNFQHACFFFRFFNDMKPQIARSFSCTVHLNYFQSLFWLYQHLSLRTSVLAGWMKQIFIWRSWNFAFYPASERLNKLFPPMSQLRRIQEDINKFLFQLSHCAQITELYKGHLHVYLCFQQDDRCKFFLVNHVFLLLIFPCFIDPVLNVIVRYWLFLLDRSYFDWI